MLILILMIGHPRHIERLSGHAIVKVAKTRNGCFQRYVVSNQVLLIDGRFRYAFIDFNHLLLIYSALNNLAAGNVDTMSYFICLTSLRVALRQILNK